MRARRVAIGLAVGWLLAVIVGLSLVEAQSDPACPPSQLERNMTVIVVPAAGVQVRDAPAGDPIDRLPQGGVHHVLGWPVCRQGLLWWQVRYVREDAWSSAGPVRQERVGWVAERAPNGDALLLPLEIFAQTYAPTPSATPSPTPPTPSATLTATRTGTPTTTPTPWTLNPTATLDPTVWSVPFIVQARPWRD